MRSDEQLMAAYVDGERAAFDELFDRYAPALFRIYRRRIEQPEDARELVQQSFLQLHRARGDYQRGRPLRPWLLTIALNLEREYFRRRGRRPEVLVAVEPAEPVPAQNGHNGGAARIDQARRARQLRRALAKLAPEQRQVIEMHWFDGLAFPEIAQILGLGLSAVKVRAHRGYNALREQLEAAATDAAERMQPADVTEDGEKA